MLYHWQRLDADRPELATRLSTFLETKRLYCSSPGAFNDPWDCRPHFNTELLQDRLELLKVVVGKHELTLRAFFTVVVLHLLISRNY